MAEQIEKSLIILKPDALERHYVGEVIKRIEGLELELRQIKLAVPDDRRLALHYPDSLAPVIGEKSKAAGTDVGGDPAAYGREVLRWNRDYMSRGPVLIMIWEGPAAISRIRSSVGHTDPSKAEPGTIRGDLGADSIALANQEKRGTENLIHASASPEEAKVEIDIWFD